MSSSDDGGGCFSDEYIRAIEHSRNRFRFTIRDTKRSAADDGDVYDEGDGFEVKKVIAHRGTYPYQEYLTEWCGVDEQGNPWDNSWEPTESFFNAHGSDEADAYAVDQYALPSIVVRYWVEKTVTLQRDLEQNTTENNKLKFELNRQKNINQSLKEENNTKQMELDRHIQTLIYEKDHQQYKQAYDAQTDFLQRLFQDLQRMGINKNQVQDLYRHKKF